MSKHFLIQSINRLFKSLGLFLLMSPLFLSSVSGGTKFSSIFYYVGQMILDPGVSINEILNHDEYIVMKGVAPDQRTAYLLAEKLFHSHMQRDFKFEDIVPFWNKNQFTFILKKPKTNDHKETIKIKSPLTRNSLDTKFTIEGSCTKDGAEITLLGDFQGTTICKKGSWVIELSVKDIKLPIVGVKVVEGPRSQGSEDYRSFLIKKP